MIENLTMNESAKVAAVAYANNTYDRREVVYARENILDAMPIGAPLTCTEIAENVKKLGVANWWGTGTLSVSIGRVAQCMKSLLPFGIVEKRIVKRDTPLVIEHTKHFSGEVYATKVIDTITKYVRVV